MIKKIILSVLIVYSTLAYSQIEFTGYLTNQKNKKLKEVSVYLYEDNNLISSSIVNTKFDFTFSANKHYTLELEKEGFFTKRIAISTIDAKPTTEPFSFIVELIANENSNEEYSSDFPSAIIEYKKSKKTFSFNETYAKSLKMEQKTSVSH